MRTLLLSALALTTIACHSADPDASQVGAVVDDGGDLTVRQVELSTDVEGQVTVEVDVQGERSFLVTVESGQNTALTRLVAPSGEMVVDGGYWYEQPYWYSEAIVGGAVDATFNWPVRGTDGPLEEGIYRATFEVYDSEYNYLVDHDVDVSTHLNSDDDVTSGFVRVLVVWADGVDDNPVAVEGTKKAVARWAEIWGQAGIGFDVSYVSSDIDANLSSPGESDALLEAGKLGDGGQMIVLVGDLVAGGGTLGESGGIPGPLVATNHTGMVLGWLESAGTDGVFADEEVNVFAETMAHEMGHYLGLFHAFEQADPETDVVSAWDALDDTPTCSDSAECEALFATNVMVPYTVYGEDDLPIPADQLSPMQAQQMQHYTGIVSAPADVEALQSTTEGQDGTVNELEASSGHAMREARATTFARLAESLSAADRAELIRARRLLSSRHASVSCPDGVDAGTYRRLIDHVTLPSSVPMRAARCLVEAQGDAAQADLAQWISASDEAGLRRLALHQIHRLSPEIAASLRALAKR
jgi:hypothetical protein